RHTFSSWQIHGNTPYTYNIFVPVFAQGRQAKVLLRGELALFKKSLEEWTGNTVTEQALDHAIEVYNTNRRLMRQVYERRRADRPPISGAEAMDMVLASQIMDKEEHNRLLADAISKLPQRKDRGEPGVRLMLLGSDTHDTRLERLIESLGATIVIDELCNGSGYFWSEVIPQEDRLIAIAMRYLDKPHCPLKDIRYRRRPTHIQHLAEDYDVQGVVMSLQKYCVPHHFDNPFVMDALRERGIPFHLLERDTTIPVGETQTRIEAFLDIFRPELVQVRHKSPFGQLEVE
ncbi:MAG: 2-hydroxyacyl-CoA dehydratase, partial [Chloroflexi bacterium]|nr:2-hydroxyacyl-CoA dehydratase [Chloroflexota bacterium]